MNLDVIAGLSEEVTTVLEISELTGKLIGIEDYDGISTVGGGSLLFRHNLIMLVTAHS